VKRRISLFQSNLRAVLLGLGVALGMTVLVGYLFVLRPLAARSADDFAALLTISARSWVELPASLRSTFVAELERDHQLDIQEVSAHPLDEVAHHPYLNLLRAALQTRMGGAEHVWVGEHPGGVFHVDLRVSGHWLRFSFTKLRVSSRPSLALVLAGLASALTSLITAAWMARRVSQPVAALAASARRIGDGELPPAFPDSNTAELHGLSEALRNMVAELAAQREHQATMLAGISHDLRSPLSRLKMAVGVLGENASKGPLRRMEVDIAEIDTLIEAQLDLFRARRVGVAQLVDIPELLREIADAAEAQRPGGVRLRCGRYCQRVLAPTALHRVLSNLVGNALNHTDGKLDIVCRHGRQMICIGVRDRGPGVPEDQREAVFRPFFRLEPSRQRASGGSGLGLAIAKQLAQTHGWRLGLRSRRGGGSSFWLLIPEASGSEPIGTNTPSSPLAR
jgi:two-component system, OmpR family, osmolarity sensor histidine kinase EnvZ